MLRIQLDRGDATYLITSTTGSVIKGILFVTVNAEMNIKGITVGIKGEGQVSWWEGNDDDRRNYSASEKYINAKIPLVLSDYEITLQPGTYEYPFQCALPPNLPSSFKGSVGYVKYYVKAKIIRTGLKRNVVENLPFIVVQQLILGLESGEFKEPFQYSEEPEVKCCHCCFCMCCWSVGTVSVNYSLNRRCFVPGESVYVSGEIVNNMSSTMQCKFSLKQRLDFYASGSKRYSIKEIVSAVHDRVSPGRIDVWTNVPLLVPALPPSRLDGCKIIDIKYYVECHVDVALSHWNKESEIIIGSAPLSAPRYNAAPYPQPVTLQPIEVQFQKSADLFK